MDGMDGQMLIGWLDFCFSASMSRMLFGGLAVVAATNNPNEYMPREIANITFDVMVVIFLIWLLKKPARFGKFCFGLMVLMVVIWIVKKAFGR
jgi:hypothetical protein